MKRGTNEPFLVGNELKYVQNCINKNEIASIGKYIDKFKKKLKIFTNAKHVVLCSSGTSALQVSLDVLGIKTGDEVIVPTFTFIATVNAVIYNNGTPIFMDCDNYCNIDIEKVIKFLDTRTYFKNGNTYNTKTRKKIFAIIPVHVWGSAVYLNKLVKICKKKNIKIIEDATESLGTKFKKKQKFQNRHVGTIGDIGCLSFNGNKIITSAGGGAILTNNENIAKKSSYLINQATNDSFSYIHKDIGYNFRMSNIHAAIGVAQLEKIKFLINKKNYINKFYKKKLSKLKEISVLGMPEYSDNNCWQTNLLINQNNYKSLIIKIKKKLSSAGFGLRMAWHPCHLQLPYKKFDSYNIEKATKMAKRLICLPCSSFLKKRDLLKITNLIIQSIK